MTTAAPLTPSTAADLTEPAPRVVAEEPGVYTVRQVIVPGETDHYFEVWLYPAANAANMAQAIKYLPAGAKPHGSDAVETDSGDALVMFFVIDNALQLPPF